MLTVLIVDDEKIICQLIQRLIDWSGLELCFVGEAYNYTQALAMIEEKNPRIVITDIKMPGANGISLIETIRSHNYDASIIAISGCREFEYARNMLKYDVEDYLLKPIQKKELNAVLQRIIDKRNQLLENETRESINHSKCRELFLRRLFDDSSFWQTEKTADEINREYQFHFTEGLYAVIAAKPDFRQETCLDQNLCDRILENIRISILDTVRDLCHEAEAVIHDSCIYILTNAAEPEKTFTDKMKKNITPIISMNIQKHEIANLSVLMDVVSGLSDLKECIQGVGKLLDYRMDMAKNSFVLRRFASFQENPGLMQKLCRQMDFKWSSFTNTLDKDGFIAFAYNTLTAADLTIHDAVALACFIVQKTDAFLTEHGIKTSCGPETAKRLKNCTDQILAGQIIKTYLEKALTDWVLLKSETEKKPVRLIKSYLEKNYNQDINLNALSKLVYLNPIYLSSMFKRETGVSITDYLIQIRIEHAKKMLVNTPMYIGDIAAAVGYKDTRYFSKLFLKQVGIKPTEYRKYHS